MAGIMFVPNGGSGGREAGHTRGCRTTGLARRGGGSYYYRKVRRGGRVVSEYLGCGPSATLMAEDDSIEREMLEASRDYWKEERERLEAEEAVAVALFDRVEALAREALEAARYHRHKRGECRKRRGKG